MDRKASEVFENFRPTIAFSKDDQRTYEFFAICFVRTIVDKVVSAVSQQGFVMREDEVAS